MQRTEPDVISVVYSGDTNASKEQIIAKAKVRVFFFRPLCVQRSHPYHYCAAKARFDITLAPQSLHFVFLESRWLVEDRCWPRFTLVGQSLGSMYLAWEALSKFVPDLYIGVLPTSVYLWGYSPVAERRSCIDFFRRYDGICFYLSRRRVCCWRSHRRIRALSYH